MYRDAVPTLGPFEILAELGSGASGRVYRARHQFLEREVALKVFKKPRDADESTWRKRFGREARAAAKLEHPNIARIYEVQEIDGQPCMAFELIQGRTLAERLAAGSFSTDEALALVEKIARALHFAHERGLIHRDLKPSNVLLDERGEPHLVDFGVAKDLGDPRAQLTEWGAIVGTPDYLAPEQALGENDKLDARVDVWALGVLLYELLSGAPPFRAGSLLALLEAIRDRSPPAPVRRDGSSTGRAGEIALWALAKDRERRPRTALELAEACAAARTRSLAPNESRTRLHALLVAVAAPAALVGAVIATHGQPSGSKDVVANTDSASVATVVTAPPRSEGPKLPDGLKLAGKEVPAADGKEVSLYLYALPDGTDMELVQVPAGELTMGADDPDAYNREKPRHVHPVTRAFWIGRTAVTWKQYLAFCEATLNRKPARPEWAGIDHPVVSVAWTDAAAFCVWAKLVLPTEAEWEKAARGADGRIYPWGNEWQPDLINFADRSAPRKLGDLEISRDPTTNDGWANTSPAGFFVKGASPSGALDMAGNVWQWCEDWWDPNVYARYAKGDMSPPSRGVERVHRGGAWSRTARSCRSAYREGFPPGTRAEDMGFRVVLRSSP